MKNILIYPGTFDPIHFGHIDALRGAMRDNDYDQVYVLLQSNRFKDSTMFSYEARLKFVVDALNLNNLNRVDVIKTDSPYFYDAIKTAGVFDEQAVNGSEVYVIIGDDTMESIEKWANFEILNLRCRFVIIQRKMEERVIYKTADRIFNRFNVILKPNEVSSLMTSTEIRDTVSKAFKDFMWKSRTSILT